MQPSEMNQLNRYIKNEARSSKTSLIIKGGSGSSSLELRLTDFKTKRRSDSVIGQKLLKLLDVVVNIRRGALAVKA